MDVTPEETSTVLPTGVLATPLWLNGCFAWLHEPAQQAGCDVALLICPPVGWDALHSYHPLRVMADALAVEGCPVLRFNYPGTGDSIDLNASGQEPWEIWQESVHRAADWLRAAAGATRIVLAGLRLGAALASLVAEARDDVAGLILLAPVLNGHSYMRQLMLEAQNERQPAPRSPPMGCGFSFLELQFSASIDRISDIDLRQVKLRPGLSVACFLQASSRRAEQTIALWRQAGVDVVQTGFGGLEALVLRPLDEDPPPCDAATVTRWLHAVLPITRTLRARPLLPPAHLQHGAFRENCHAFRRRRPIGWSALRTCQRVGDRRLDSDRADRQYRP